tara:strand:- start:88 stop:345 length:258 start_codon:yes stop_codon:yes gene_type:complete
MFLSFLFGYLKFIGKSNIISLAIAIIVGNLVTDMMNRIKDDIILPLSTLNFKELYKKISIKEYIGLAINFLLQTFIIYTIFGKLI